MRQLRYPFNFKAVSRLLFTSDNDGLRGYAWASVSASPSNFVTSTCDSILDGTIVEGIRGATFGESHLTAAFGSLVKSSVAEWRQEGDGHPFAADDRDLDPWSRPPLPVI